MGIGLVTLVVHDYEEAIAFYVGKLGWTLRHDEPSETTDGRAKRWVVVGPPDGGPGLLLAQADGAHQESRVGDQTGGRVGFFLYTGDIQRDVTAYRAAGVEFVRDPSAHPYGTVAVFRDLYGNQWDLIEPMME